MGHLIHNKLQYDGDMVSTSILCTTIGIVTTMGVVPMTGELILTRDIDTTRELSLTCSSYFRSNLLVSVYLLSTFILCEIQSFILCLYLCFRLHVGFTFVFSCLLNTS